MTDVFYIEVDGIPSYAPVYGARPMIELFEDGRRQYGAATSAAAHMLYGSLTIDTVEHCVARAERAFFAKLRTAEQ